MTEQEAAALAALMQPELSLWLRERLGHLPFRDAMLVTKLLLQTGAETAENQLRKTRTPERGN